MALNFVCKGIFLGAAQISNYSTLEKIEFTEFQSLEFRTQEICCLAHPFHVNGLVGFFNCYSLSLSPPLLDFSLS